MPHKQKNVQVVLDKPAVTSKIGKDSVKMHFRCKKSYKDYTYEEISKFFDKPIKDVSEELGVSVTFLKKVCRRLNIPRWPFRKISALHKRITQIEETISEQVPSKTQVELLQKQQMLKNSLSQVIERSCSSASLVSFSSQVSLADMDNEEGEDGEENQAAAEDEDDNEAENENNRELSTVKDDIQGKNNSEPVSGGNSCNSPSSPVLVAAPQPVLAPTPTRPLGQQQPEESRIINHLQAFQPRNASFAPVANSASSPIIYHHQPIQAQQHPVYAPQPHYYSSSVPQFHHAQHHFHQYQPVAPVATPISPIQPIQHLQPVNAQRSSKFQQYASPQVISAAPQNVDAPRSDNEEGMKKLPSFNDFCKYIGI